MRYDQIGGGGAGGGGGRAPPPRRAPVTGTAGKGFWDRGSGSGRRRAWRGGEEREEAAIVGREGEPRARVL
jgi:hypothetical protein